MSRAYPAVPALLLALVVGVASGCGDRGAVETGRPDGVPDRRLLSAAWDTLFRVGGVETDTTIFQATRIGADARGVSLVDRYAGRVLRFDTAGRLRWAYGGRGGGPDEFRRPRDVAVDAEGRTWVLDALNARVTVLGPDGGPAFRIPLDGLEGAADGLAPLAGDRAVVYTLDREAPFVVVGPDGEVGQRWTVPWDGFARLSPLASQMKLAGRGGGGPWAAAFVFGDAFHLFGADGEPVARGWLPDRVPFPRVSVSTSGSALGRRRRVTRVERPRYGAVSVAMADDRLYVLSGGRGAAANRWIDSYALADGGYAGSFLAPRPVNAIAYGGGVFYVTYPDPYPALAAWRPRPPEGR